ncbi:MAG: glycerol-3-phosphate 1-O-acyltransferase PlsY [Planctomycetota bacterium]
MPLPWLTSPGALAALAASYLLGAIPFGLVMVRLIKGVDLRTQGSGNIGATNAMRVLGKPLGLVAFLLDWGKGLVASLWLYRLAEGADLRLQVACGAAAVIGHCFPVYLRFKGGKGVATACGAVVAIDPVVFVIAGAVWLALAFGLRYVSVASMGMGLAFPVAAWFRWGHRGDSFVVGLCALTLLILVRHKSNIARLRAGTEPKIGAGKKKAE